MRPVADITAEIDTVEARIAALKCERVIALIPQDWTETVLAELREAFRGADFDTYGEARRFQLGENVAVYLRVEIFDPDATDEEEGEIE